MRHKFLAIGHPGGVLFAPIVLAGLILCATPSAWAQSLVERQFITFQAENDLFANLANTDRHYTNGLQASWLSAQRDLPDWLESMTALPLLGGGQVVSQTHRIGIALGHSIFTPDDTDLSDPIVTDRPYAAWLHTSFTVQSVRRTDTGSALQDQWKLDLGVVGPAAFGEQVQNNWHDLIGAEKAHGWDNQIKNEPGLNLTFERSWRTGFFETPSFLGLQTDFIPYGVAALGNVQTYGALGGGLRIGPGLPDDFGPPRIYPGIGGSEWFDTADGFDWYLFAGAEARLIGRDIFLDGNSFRSSHSVDKKNLVTDMRLGAVAILGQARISATHVFRSREFHGQTKPDQFGSVTLSWGF